MLIAHRLGLLIVVQPPAPLGLLLVLLLLDPAAGRMPLDCQLPLFLSLLAPPVSCWELPTVLGPSRPLLAPLRVITKNQRSASGSFMKILPKKLQAVGIDPARFQSWSIACGAHLGARQHHFALPRKATFSKISEAISSPAQTWP